MADGKIPCGPDFAYPFRCMDSEFEIDMTQICQTWMCLRCRSLTDRVWFIVGGEAPLVGSNREAHCRACGSANLNLGSSSCNQSWEGDYLVVFSEESV